MQDSVYILVRPASTEVEPNNGPLNANALQPGVPLIGKRDYVDDQDWFRVLLPPGAGMQVTMVPATSNPGGVWTYAYYGSIRNRQGDYLADVNRTYENLGETTAEVFVVVDGSGWIPYRVKVDLYGP